MWFLWPGDHHEWSLQGHAGEPCSIWAHFCEGLHVCNIYIWARISYILKYQTGLLFSFDRIHLLHTLWRTFHADFIGWTQSKALLLIYWKALSNWGSIHTLILSFEVYLWMNWCTGIQNSFFDVDSLLWSPHTLHAIIIYEPHSQKIGIGLYI